MSNHDYIFTQKRNIHKVLKLNQMIRQAISTSSVTLQC